MGAALFGWFTDAGYEAELVTSFDDAKARLPSRPDLLISEVRLAEYNGLHLVSRAQALGIRSIVIGEADPVLERDAHDMGATYLHPNVDRDEILALARRLTSDDPQPKVVAIRRSAAANLAFLSSGDLTTVAAQTSKSKTDVGVRRLS
jgi:DNA-binding response OmpR family regulator